MLNQFIRFYFRTAQRYHLTLDDSIEQGCWFGMLLEVGPS